MTENQKPSSWLTWLVVGLVLLVSYPLSIIPAFSLAEAGYLPCGMIGAYQPDCIASEWMPRQIVETYNKWSMLNGLKHYRGPPASVHAPRKTATQ